MTLEELKVIENTNNELVTDSDLYNLNDRTLLYGYTCDRETLHVYLKDGGIHTVIYKLRGFNDGIADYDIREVNVKSNEDYVQSKRLYPNACDFEFCKLLKARGIYLSFTTFEDEWAKKDFYGTILDVK